MELVSSECVILHNQDYGERDRIVTFLAQEGGLLKGIVKGSRKLTGRGVGSFEPLMCGVIHYVPNSGEGLVMIRKCDPHPPYLITQINSGGYDAYLFGSYLAELTRLCGIPPEEAEDFHALLSGSLEALSTVPTPRHLPLIRLRFELRLLGLLGYAPDWRQCAGCEGALPAPPGEWGDTHGFDLGLGGVRCPACLGGRPPVLPLAPRALAFLAQWLDGTAPPQWPSQTQLEDLLGAVTAHLTHHLERRPRSLDMLPGLASLAGARKPPSGQE